MEKKKEDEDVKGVARVWGWWWWRAVRVGIVCRRTHKQTAGTCHHVDRQGSQTYRVDCEEKGRR